MIKKNEILWQYIIKQSTNYDNKKTFDYIVNIKEVTDAQIITGKKISLVGFNFGLRILDIQKCLKF